MEGPQKNTFLKHDVVIDANVILYFAAIANDSLIAHENILT
jgi:hypothetical protein